MSKYDIKTPSDGERFADKLLEAYGAKSEDRAELKRLIQGYYVFIDRALQEKNAAIEDGSAACVWANVNLEPMGEDLMSCARVGLDMMGDKELFPVISQSTDKTKYDVSTKLGVNGLRHIALKYAANPPKDVTVDLIYDTDKFEPILRGKQDSGEGAAGDSYKFSVAQPFARGNLIGGFAYLEYESEADNRLVMLQKSDILKRQALEENPPEESDPWFGERCIDTIKWEVYSPRHIPRDPAKIDDAYWYLKMKQ